MSKPMLISGMFATVVFFIPSLILGAPNLQGNLDKILTHGEKDRFRFFVFGDSKHEAGNLSRLDQIFDAAKGKKPLFMIVVGDFVVNGTERKYHFFLDKIEKAGFEKAGIPLFLVIGNHELGKKDQSKKLFNKYFGATHYWFSYGNSLFVVADNGSGSLDKAQLQWIETILKEKRQDFLHTFFFTHYPPTTFNFKKDKSFHQGAEAFMTLMERYRVDQVFSGHYHTYRRQSVNGVTYLVSGGGGAKLHDNESFFHYVEVTVNGPAITENVVPLDSSYSISNVVAYNLSIHIFPWLLSHYSYLLLSLVVLGLLVSIVIFQRKKSRLSK